MICEGCKNELSEGAKFCPNCGSKVEKKEPPKVEVKKCGQCGAEFPAAAKFCKNDGSALESVMVAAPVEAAAAPVAAPAAGQSAAKPVQTEVPGGAPAAKKSNAMLWIIVAVILVVSAAGGGFMFYKMMMKAKDATMNADQMGGYTAPGQQPADGAMPPQQPGAVDPNAQAQPPAPAPAEQPMPAQTNVSIKSSITAADVVNGKAIGKGTKFKQANARVAHLVQYVKATPGQTTFSSQFYKDGALLFECAAKQLQYASGNYFCRPKTNLAPGSYEVRFYVDGLERQTLMFTVQ